MNKVMVDYEEEPPSPVKEQVGYTDTSDRVDNRPSALLFWCMAGGQSVTQHLGVLGLSYLGVDKLHNLLDIDIREEW